MIGKSKKIKASELLIKLREAVIKLVEQVKDIKFNLDGLNMRVNNLEKRIVALENKIKNLTSVAPKPVAKSSPTKEGDQLDLLAKELGLEVGLEEKTEVSEVPTPPPPPSIENIRTRNQPTTEQQPVRETTPPTGPTPEPIKSEELLGMESIGKEELDKDKDDLLKALKELDEL